MIKITNSIINNPRRASTLATVMVALKTVIPAIVRCWSPITLTNYTAAYVTSSARLSKRARKSIARSVPKERGKLLYP